MGKSMLIKDILKRLKEENPEALADNKPHSLIFGSVEMKEDMSPSEIKRMSDIITKRRLLGEGLSDEQLKGVMRRIGHGR